MELPEKFTAANTVVHARSATVRIVSIFFIIPRHEKRGNMNVLWRFSLNNEVTGAVIFYETLS